MPALMRTIRAITDELRENRRFLTERERKREESIVASGRAAMARLGRHEVTLVALAGALRIAPATFRQHYCELDSLLAHILKAHLNDIATALYEAGKGDGRRQAACRAAYHRATRTALGGYTEAHLLLVRDRHLLPPDLLAPIEARLQALAETLAGAMAPSAFTFLDALDLSLDDIEHNLAANYARQQAADAGHARQETADASYARQEAADAAGAKDSPVSPANGPASVPGGRVSPPVRPPPPVLVHRQDAPPSRAATAYRATAGPA
jgi:AcrR family transcriptional regulator